MQQQFGKCPKCQVQMSEFPLDSRVQVGFCSECKGMWLDRGALGRTCGKSHDFPESAAPIGREIQTNLPCARCENNRLLTKRPYAPNSVEVEYCKTCFGIFLDFRELPAVQAVLKASITESEPPFVAPLARPTLKEAFSLKEIRRELKAPRRRIDLPRPWRILIAVILGLLVFPSLFGQMSFLFRAAPAMGNVIEVSAFNARCSSTWSKHRYDCTEFNATLEYRAKDNTKHLAKVSAGDVRGYNNSILAAELQPLMVVPILYDPEDFNRISRDRFWEDGWGGALGKTILFTILFGFLSR